MLKSNWTVGSAPLAGHARVIRQKLGLAAPRKSASPHKFMAVDDRAALCAKLEWAAARKRA